MGVQFKSLANFKFIDFGRLFKSYEELGFCESQDLFRLNSVIEKEENQINLSGLLMTIQVGLNQPRVMFLDSERDYGQNVIQIQNDRFIYNWRRKSIDSSSYTAYEENLEKFFKYFEKFKNYVSSNNFGDLSIDQCEMSYVNLIPVESKSNNSDEMFSTLFPFWSKVIDDNALAYQFRSDNCSFSNSYWINNHKSRLYIEAKTNQSNQSNRSNNKHIDFVLLVRGEPNDGDNINLKKWFDTSHEILIKSFLATTSNTFHEKWSRK